MTVASLVGFARALREAGVAADAHRVPALLAAVDLLGIDEAYWAGRLTLCAEPDDLPVYDRVFHAYFTGAAPERKRPPMPTVAVPFFGGAPSSPAHGQDEEEGVVGLSTSPVEILRTRDVALLTAPERAEIRRLLALLEPAAAPRRTRRRRPASRGEVDPRGTVRALIRNGGEPVALRRRDRLRRPRRLVLLVDVSGSMTPYADALLRFAHAAVRRRPTRTEVFTLGTRLTRVTRALRHRDPDAAQAAAGAVIPDWHGGTRLADSIAAFVGRWGRRGTARGAVVLIFSDGWERGDPADLATRLAHLRRLAHRLVWVNPHRGKDGYAPLAGGMAAALPFCDDFVAGHSLGALEELVRVIARA